MHGVGHDSMQPSARMGHGSCTVGHTVYVLGGRNAEGVQKDLHCLDTAKPEKARWVAAHVQGQVPSARSAHSMTSIGQHIYVFGGQGADQQNVSSEVYVLDTVTMIWNNPEVMGRAPERRHAHTATAMGTSIVILGGTGTQGAAIGGTWILDTIGMRWKAVPAGPDDPLPRDRHTATACNNRLYLFGGWDGQQCFNTVHVLDQELEWTCVPMDREDIVEPRAAHTAACVGKHTVVVIGGWNGTDLLEDKQHPPSSQN